MYICVCKLLSKAQMSVELILEVCVIRHCDIVCRIIDMLLNICYSLLSSRTFHTVIVISLKYHVNVRHYQLSKEGSSSHSPYKPPPSRTQIVTHSSQSYSIGTEQRAPRPLLPERVQPHCLDLYTTCLTEQASVAVRRVKQPSDGSIAHVQSHARGRCSLRSYSDRRWKEGPVWRTCPLNKGWKHRMVSVSGALDGGRLHRISAGYEPPGVRKEGVTTNHALDTRLSPKGTIKRQGPFCYEDQDSCDRHRSGAQR